MAKIIDELTKANWRGLYHFRYGYEEAPIITMLFYDLSSLNSSDVDFKNARVKHAKYEKTRFGDAKKITWYEDSVKEEWFTVDSDVTASTPGDPATLTVTSITLQKGDVIRDITTQETMLVTNVSGSSVTVNALYNDITAATDKFLLVGFAKTYGEYSARAKDLNDYIPYDNYVQFCSAEIPEEKTDILTNNLDRLFYPTVKDYLKELYAEASRTIIKTMIYSLYVWVASEVTTTNGKKIYTAGWLEYFIPASAKDKNIYAATPKGLIKNLQNEVVAAYKSWVSGLNRGNRLMMFANYAMSAAITDAFLDMSNLNINDNTTLSKFGINMKEFNLNGYKITLVEDPTLDTLYGDAPVGFIIDLDGISLINLVEWVISENGKTTDALWASIIFCPPQQTYEMRTVSLNTHFSWVFKNISSGCYRKLICHA